MGIRKREINKWLQRTIIKERTINKWDEKEMLLVSSKKSERIRYLYLGIIGNI